MLGKAGEAKAPKGLESRFEMVGLSTLDEGAEDSVDGLVKAPKPNGSSSTKD
ncbi:hypothetical protein K7432_005763 [Basidiobolus ranarum]|uniref:Uncharacterized protein n=1 Tax=Basidiobolus ranarum TaxID=34480 RepID=A0ABR2WW66_9FUNG